MDLDNDPPHVISACGVEVSPSEVDARGDLTLKVELPGSATNESPASALLIKDQNAALVQRLELAERDAENAARVEIVVAAPAEPGSYTWFAVRTADETSAAAEEGATPFSFRVKPHRTHVVVWDVPAAVERGEAFNIKLGVKCSSECAPDGWMLEVRDDAGRKLARTPVSDGPWTGTAALYYAEVALRAPDKEGLYAWEAAAQMTDLDVPHTESQAGFGLRVVARPECLLTIVAMDRESQSPIAGAKVVVHPYRAATDARGVAELRVPKGEYRVFVSGRNYFPFRDDHEIDADMTIRAELDVDVGPSDADVWS